MSGHSLEREAREYMRARRRPMAEPETPLTWRSVVAGNWLEIVAGVFTLLLCFVAIAYGLPVLAEAMR